MSDLLSLLGLGAGGLAAQNAGVSVAANNTANVDTAGYSRQRVDLEAQLAAPLVGGVRAGNPQRVASDLLAGRMRGAGGSLGASTARSAATLDLQDAVAGGGTPLDAQIAALFAAFGQVAASPTDSNLRSQAVAAARTVAAGLGQRAAAVAQVRSDANARIRDDATQATQLAAKIASANQQLGAHDDPVVRDQRDQAALQLAGLVGGTARIDPDGQMRVVLDGGAVLVDGARAAKLTATPDAATGFSKLEVVDGTSRRDVTGEIAGGAIGGELAVRDVDGAQAAAGLDQLAYDLATQVDAVHEANAGADGVTGRDLFVQPGAVAGAAAAIAVDPTVAADPSKLAVAAPGAGPGDATGANALLALRDAQVAAGGTRTLGDAAIDLAAGVGQAAATAKDDATRDTTVADGLASLRDSISGVDLAEESASLSQFQHAASAMTQFIQTVNTMLDDLLARL